MVLFTRIVSQYLILLITSNRYEEAKNICEKHPTSEEIQPQYIAVLSHFDEKEKMDSIIKTYPYNRFVCRSYAYSSLRNNNYEEALDACKNHLYDDDILKLYNYISLKISRRNIKINKDSSELYNKIMSCIDNNDFSQAKSLCKLDLNDKKIFEVYLSILEKERIKTKTYINVDK